MKLPILRGKKNVIYLFFMMKNEWKAPFLGFWNFNEYDTTNAMGVSIRILSDSNITRIGEQGYNGAESMSGKTNIVQVELKKFTPYTLYIWFCMPYYLPLNQKIYNCVYNTKCILYFLFDI